MYDLSYLPIFLEENELASTNDSEEFGLVNIDAFFNQC
jgi:hypothetical protein